jgi:hypothetical protein
MSSNNAYQQRRRYVKEYIRSLNELERAMEPFKEQIRDLRNEYRTNGWLDTDEIRAAVKAYRMIKSSTDGEEVYDNFKMMIGDQRFQQEE